MTNKTAICGYTGYVGGYLSAAYPDSDFYNSKNLSSIRGKEYDVIYFASVPAVKWLANKEPENDLKTIQAIEEELRHVKCARFVLISTIDVHDHSVLQSEKEEEPKYNAEPYGKHRRMFEEFCEKQFSKCHVIRLPALFGLGIKKNYLYDMLNNRLLHTIHMGSSFQWYDLRWIASDIAYMIEHDIPLLHAYSEPVSTGEIVRRFFSQHLAEIEKSDVQKNTPLKYAHKTVYRLRKAEEVFTAMGEFVNVYRAIQSGFCDRLCVSNLHWTPAQDAVAMRILQTFGVKKVELVPGKYFDWAKWTEADALAIRKKYNDEGIDLVSLQAIMFGINGSLHDVDVYAAALHRTDDAIKVASLVGAKRIVYGSPKLRAGGCTTDDLVRQLKDCIPFLEKSAGVVICLEPNSKDYGCDIGYNMTQVQNMVTEINSPHIKINFDTGNADMEHDPCPKALADVAHIQVSMPFLKAMDADKLKHMKKTYGDALFAEETKHCAISMEANVPVSHLFENLFALVREMAPHA